MIRVLVADDHAVVRRGLRLFLDLQEDLEVVAEAANGEEAVELALADAPDVVLMDLAMPRVDGVEATRRLAQETPGVRVLVLSSFVDHERLTAVLRAGAAGYLMKDAAPEEITDAIRSVHRGEPVLCKAALLKLMRGVAKAQQRPEGTVTILFTDIEGSTAMLERLGEQEARALFREHDRLLQEIFERHGGHEVDHEGDSFMFVFPAARQAVLGAVEAQRALQTTPLRVRIGLNTGDVIAEETGYFGRAVFLASRIAGRARGGEILVSEVTRALAQADALCFGDRGDHELRGLSGCHRLWEVDWTPSAS